MCDRKSVKVNGQMKICIDLICKIKDNILEAFWKFIEEYFRSKYIIFEFKNYDKKFLKRRFILQKNIYLQRRCDV